jgi:NADPH:quinone reductase-like Zn-dependent oxidoreductase
MKAIILKGFGGVENLVYAEIPRPIINEGEVLIQAKAIDINPIDIKTRAGKGAAGKLKDFDPIILGWDVAGIVVESKSALLNIGDKVFAMENFPGHGKAYAEYVAAPASQLAIIPKNISFEDAAAATLAALTAWQNLVNYTTIKAGDRVLIHAAAGGVGHFAVQMAKHFGAYVIGTSSAANKDFVVNLGADKHIDYKSQRFEDMLSDIDFVLDAIGGDNIDRSLKVMKHGATIISIPTVSNEGVVEKAKAKGMIGCRTTAASNGADMKSIADLLESGTVKSHVSKIFSFDEMKEAHLQIESGRTVGKIVVTVD